MMTTAASHLLQSLDNGRSSIASTSDSSATAAADSTATLKMTNVTSSSSSSRSNNRKRLSDKQLTKDDAENGNFLDSDSNDDECEGKDGERKIIKQSEFSRASESVLQNRKIVRAKRPYGIGTVSLSAATEPVNVQ
jgi:hypothetical protein